MHDVSIAIVYYAGINDEYFRESLRGAFGQKDAGFEVHLYHEDKLPGFIDEYGQVVCHQIPKDICGKVAKVREHIVATARTPFLAFWDADDVYYPDKLLRQRRLTAESNLDICFTNFSFLGDVPGPAQDFFSAIGFGKRDISIFDENYVGLGTVLARTEFLRSLTPFPETDVLDWWIAAKTTLVRGKMFPVSQPCSAYRVYDRSLSRLFVNVHPEDFERERAVKANLYALLSKEYPEFGKRREYYQTLDVKKNINHFLEKYMKNRYKNAWGGLISYVEE